MSVVKIKQQPDVPEVPAEVIAQSIEAIAAGMKKLNTTRLTRRALVILLAEQSHVNRGEVIKVLDALDALEKTWLKSKDTAKDSIKK